MQGRVAEGSRAFARTGRPGPVSIVRVAQPRPEGRAGRGATLGEHGTKSAIVQRQLIGVGTMLERSNVLPHPDDVFLSTPEIRGGVACFAGTRVGVSQLLGYLRDGHTIDDFLSDFPTVKKAQAQFAIERIDNEYVRAIERACAREHRSAPSVRSGSAGESVG